MVSCTLLKKGPNLGVLNYGAFAVVPNEVFPRA